MNKVSDMSGTKIALVAALLAIATAVLVFGAAMVTGGARHVDDATEFHIRSVPEVRYVMNYEIDPTLYSFYQSQQDEAPARVAARSVDDAGTRAR